MPDQPKPVRLKFTFIPGQFAICKLPVGAPIPAWALKGVFTSVTRTADELSMVCEADNLPADVNSESHWICLKLEGPFAFTQTGILASFIDPLAENAIPIFAISTYDTDYVLIKEEHWAVAYPALQNAGHQLLGDEDKLIK
jgi:uncharacterized protein